MKQKEIVFHCEHCEGDAPKGYLQWQAWAEEMEKNYTQEICPQCYRWTLWKRKNTVRGSQSPAARSGSKK